MDNIQFQLLMMMMLYNPIMGKNHISCKLVLNVTINLLVINKKYLLRIVNL